MVIDSCLLCACMPAMNFGNGNSIEVLGKYPVQLCMKINHYSCVFVQQCCLLIVKSHDINFI